MEKRLPKMADIRLAKMMFQPGDRILVHAKGVLSDFQRKQIQRTVGKWAGGDVEVLVLDDTIRNVRIERVPSLGANPDQE